MTAGAVTAGRQWRAAALALLALAALCCLQPAPAWAQEGNVASEDAVKAAYLFRFLGYVDWPPNALGAADAPLVIGVYGADAVFAELQRVLPGRNLQGRPLQARRLAAPDAPLEGVHVVFVGEPGSAALAGWAARLRERPVLLVSADPAGLRAGAMLNFVLVQGRVRFEAAPFQAERSGLKLSSKLLAVAERVLNGP
jgi:hypothetical protein